MADRDEEIFTNFRPLRNLISQFNVIESLYFIWTFSRNYTFNKEFPRNNEWARRVNLDGLDKFERQMAIKVIDHDLEYLAKVILLYGDIAPSSKKIVEYRYSNNVFVLYSRLFQTADKNYVNTNNILMEFHRIAHRQFVWQKGYSGQEVYRYYKIYGNPEVSAIVENKLGLSSHTIFLITSFLFSYLGEHFQIRLPFNIKSDKNPISLEMMEKYLNIFSISLNEAKAELRESQQLNHLLFYTYNILLAKPIIKDSGNIFSPIPLMIYWQMTTGLYYHICGEPGFSGAFGSSFESYVGDVLTKSIIKDEFTISPEEKYGQPEKRTSDWLVSDSNSILFIECKTKRMKIGSKTELDISNSLETDIKAIAKAVTQLYKSYLDYQSDLFPTTRYDPEKVFFPLVLTLEEWYISFNPQILDIIKGFVIIEFEALNINTDLLELYPYTVACSSEFEKDAQLINELGISEFYAKLRNNNIIDYKEAFDYRDIYQGEYERIFVKPFTDLV